MCDKHRALVEEHLVRRDENGFSLDHALVSDLNRSLMKEMEETAKLLYRIRCQRQSNTNEYRTYGHQITSKDIERLLDYEIKKKDMNEKSKTPETRKLIDYSDLFV